MKTYLGALLILALLGSFGGYAYLVDNVAYAAALTALSDTLSSSKVSTLSSHTIHFTTPTGANQNTDTIIITFPSDFNFTSKTIGTVSFTHGATTGVESTETLAASPSGTAWGAVFSGTQNRILTLTAPTDGTGSAVLAPSDKVIITYDSTNSTNPSSPANYLIAITGAFGDTGSFTVPILTDDQVAVSATVGQSLTFTISDNTIGFGSLSAAASIYATGDTNGTTTEAEAHNIIVATNAASGYNVTVKGATLTHASGPTITAIGGSNTAPSTGNEQFGLRASASGFGSGTVTAPYAASGFAYAANATTTSQIASASAATDSNTYSLRYLANIGATTDAGAYTAALTYTGTANF